MSSREPCRRKRNKREGHLYGTGMQERVAMTACKNESMGKYALKEARHMFAMVNPTRTKRRDLEGQRIRSYLRPAGGSKLPFKPRIAVSRACQLCYTVFHRRISSHKTDSTPVTCFDLSFCMYVHKLKTNGASRIHSNKFPPKETNLRDTRPVVDYGLVCTDSEGALPSDVLPEEPFPWVQCIVAPKTDSRRHLLPVSKERSGAATSMPAVDLVPRSSVQGHRCFPL